MFESVLNFVQSTFLMLRQAAGSDIVFAMWGGAIVLAVLFLSARVMRIVSSRRRPKNLASVRKGTRYDTDEVRSLRKARENSGASWQ